MIYVNYKKVSFGKYNIIVFYSMLSHIYTHLTYNIKMPIDSFNKLSYTYNLYCLIQR